MTLIVMILIAAYYAISLWVACGALAYGLTFAYFQGEYPTLAERHEGMDRKTARHFAIGGPIGMLVALSCGGI